MTIRTAWLGDWLWFLAWFLGSAAACYSTARNIGATFDEPVYIARGLEGWRTCSHHGMMKMGTMPLATDLYTLPLYIAERCRGVPFDLTQDVDILLPYYRLGVVVFWGILLFYGRLIARSLAGPWAGRLAVAMLACEPTLLAHASLGTTDIAVTACLTAFVYHFRAGREAGWRGRLAVPTLWCAAAILAKASALVFAPLCMVAIELERLGGQGSLRWPTFSGWRTWCRETWKILRPARHDMSWIMGGGFLLVCLYCGCDWQPLPSFISWANKLPDGSVKGPMVWLAEHLCIFSNAGEGLIRQVSHNLKGHGVYILDHTAPRFFWYYFPVAITMKLSIPLLLAPLAVGLLNRRALVNWATVTAFALLLFSLNCHVQIGIRLVLPLVVMLAIGVAGGLVQALSTLEPGWQRRLLTGGAAVGVLWSGLAAALVWPNWLCYTNELWGGTDRGYLCLSDSNYDWGQGLPELAQWRQSHGNVQLDVWYFGTDPRMDHLPMRLVRLHDLPIHQPDDVVAQVQGHYLAVSTTLLYGSYGMGQEPEDQALQTSAAFLRACTPVARTETFFIYDFTHVEQKVAAAAR